MLHTNLALYINTVSILYYLEVFPTIAQAVYVTYTSCSIRQTHCFEIAWG